MHKEKTTGRSSHNCNAIDYGDCGDYGERPWSIISRTGAVSAASTVQPQASAFISDQLNTNGTVK